MWYSTTVVLRRQLSFLAVEFLFGAWVACWWKRRRTARLQARIRQLEGVLAGPKRPTAAATPAPARSDSQTNLLHRTLLTPTVERLLAEQLRCRCGGPVDSQLVRRLPDHELWLASRCAGCGVYALSQVNAQLLRHRPHELPELVRQLLADQQQKLQQEALKQQLRRRQQDRRYSQAVNGYLAKHGALGDAAQQAHQAQLQRALAAAPGYRSGAAAPRPPQTAHTESAAAPPTLQAYLNAREGR